MLKFLKWLFGESSPNAQAHVESGRAAVANRSPADAGVRESEEPFEHLVAGVRDYAVFLLDRQGNVQTWNAGAERIKGWRAEEIVGQHFSCFYAKESVSSGWPTHELQVAAATGRFEDEGWRVRKDGSRFWANVVITALRDESGEVRGFLKITRDLTDRKQAEEKLRLSEERFRLMVEQVKEYAIIMLDPQGRVATWNAGAERLYCYTAEQVIGQHFARFYPQEAIDRGWPDEMLRRAAAEGALEDEDWRVRQDGARFWANVVITPVRDDAGSLRGFAKITRDLTERRQAEQQARRLLQEEAARKAAEESAQEIERQREQLHVTLASIGDGVIVTDPNGDVTFLNPVAAGLTGWEPHEAAGQPLERVFPVINEETRQVIENPVRRVFRERAVVELANHTALVARDGREVPVEDTAAPIRARGDNINGAVLVFRDVTEARRAKEARQYLAAIVESSDDAIIGMTLDGRIASWNRGAKRLYGYTAEEVVDQPLSLLVPPDHPDEVPALMERIKRGEYIEHFETQRVRQGGGRVDVSLTISPVRNAEGQIIGASKIARDITGRKRTEEALRRSERELLDFFENASVGLHWVGPDGTILRANRAELELLGYSAEEYVGRNITEFHADEDVICDILRRLTRGEELHGYEARLRCKDGSIKHVVINSSVLWEDGRFVHTRCFTRDITERKRAEEALRESERRLATELEAITRLHALSTRLLAATDLPAGLDDVLQEAILVCRAEFGNIQLYNPKSEALEIIAQQGFREDFLDYFRTVRVDEGSCGAQAMQSGERMVIEDVELDPSYEPHRGIAAAAGYRGVQSTPLKDRNGKVIGMLSTHFRQPHRPSERDQRLLDLHARHAADLIDRFGFEEALRRSEAQYRQLADAMPQIVWATGADGVIDYSNRRWYEYTGLPEGMVGNEGWQSVVHPDDMPLAAEKWAESLRSGTPFDMEIRLRGRHTGGYRWHLMRTVPVPNDAGTVVRWYGSATDIDEQKRAGEAARFLAEASAALATLVDYESTLQKVANLAVPYFADWSAVDVAGENGSLRRLAVAHKEPEKVRLAQELLRRYPPDPNAPAGITHVLRTGQSEIVEEVTDEMLVQGAKDEDHLRLMRSLGLRSYICVPLTVSGRTLGVLTFATAESGRTYTRSDLSLAEDLAHRATVAIENANLYQAMREEDKRKTEFLALLAHELRNPLAPLRNALQVLRLAGDNREALEQSRTLMERQLQHMVRLVDDLLDISRISRGKLELRKERITVASVVNHALDVCGAVVKEKGHDLSVTLPQEPLFVDADKTRLAQAVCNLLNNAVKYSEGRSRLWLTVRREGDKVLLCVKDEGLGIPPSMLPRVFDPFTQVDRTLEKAQGGLGIGLTIVKRLVEMHGGTVEARSEGYGKGSEFIIRVPLVASVAQGQPGPGDDQQARQTAVHRILVVDDNVDSATSLAMMLQLMGHEIRTAHDGLQGIEAASEFRPDVILLDIGMPKLNGYDACRRIREQAWAKNTVIVALTGWGQEDDRRRSQEAGFNNHLVKPVEPAALEKLLSELGSEKT